MTPLFTIPQEMFFVVLTLVFFAALVSDLRYSKFFRAYKHTRDPWKDASKDVKVLMCLLFAFMTWAQDKDSQQIIGGNGLTDSMLEIVIGGGLLDPDDEELFLELYGDNLLQGGLLEENTGITWAVQTGNPPFTSNAVLTAHQFQAGFACIAVTNIQSATLAMTSNAVVYTNWPYAVARQSVLLPQGCIPANFAFGGCPVTNLYMAASGVLSFNAPKSSPRPATNGIPDGTPQNYIAVFQTPSDIVPTNGLFWYAPGTNSALFTWKDVYLGQDTNCLATAQAELYRDGDFTCRYYFPSLTNSYASLTNTFLIGAQNLSGGETVLHTNALSAIHSSFLPAFELRWKSLAGLDPNTPDYDSDGLSDADELFIYRTDPRNRDTDGDGLTDDEELSLYGTDPNAFSSDASGQGDLWQMLGGLAPSDAPYTNAVPSGFIGILTVTTFLENAPTGGGAVLRIGNQYIPVLAGTTLVSRIAVPRGATNLFILARGVNCDNAVARVSVEASSFTKIRDPSGVFSWSFVLSPSCVTASGTLVMPSYTITPAVVCFHSPTSSVCRITSADPDIYFWTTQGFVREYTPQVPEIPPESFSNGTIQVSLVSMDMTLSTRASVTNIPAHFCNPNGDGSDDYPNGEAYEEWCKFVDGEHIWAPGFSATNCPCLSVTNAFDCPCSGNGQRPCTCAHTVYDAKAMPPEAVHTNVLGHAALVIGGTNDHLYVTVPEGTWSTCPLCSCASGIPSSASIYRQTSCIGVTPGILTTNGIFSVAGVQPSTNFEDTVFIYREADYSGSTPVISYTRKDYTVLGTAVYPTDPGHSVSNWFIGCTVTNALTIWTGVKLPSDTGEVTFSVTVESGTPAPQLYAYNRVAQTNELLITQGQLTFTQNLGTWRDTYCDTNGYVQAYLLCASGGVARVSHGFETYSGQPFDLLCNKDQRFSVIEVDINGDYNRDGNPVDDAAEASPVTFDSSKGMVILANTDDDFSNQTKEPDCSDNFINGSSDLSDIYTLKIRKLGINIESIPDELTLTLSVENPAGELEGAPFANSRIRIFRSKAADSEGVIGPTPQTNSVVFKKTPATNELDIALLTGTGYLEIGVEGIEFGRQVIVNLSASLNGNSMSSDSVRLLVAPFLLLSNLAPASKVYIAAANEAYCWSNLYADVSAALNGVVALETYSPATFIQDKAEIGYTCSAPNQTTRKQNIVMGFGSDWFKDLLGSDTGFFLSLIGIDGGNLEVSPPIQGFDYGRIVVGKDKASLAMTRAFFEAQKVQTDAGALIELPVGWLEVGHVDEVFTLIPSGTGFKVLVADLDMAINLLRNNSTNETFGGFPTRADILATYDDPYNSLTRSFITNKIATIRSSLSVALGINENDFIKVPVPFNVDGGILDPSSFACLPNMINMLVVKNVNGQRKLLVPKPYFDPFTTDLSSKLINAGYQATEIEWIDTRDPHVGYGEIHCSTNVKREAP